jgi:hypothetical protein
VLTAAVVAALVLASGASSAADDAIDKAMAKVRAAKVLEEGALRVLVRRSASAIRCAFDPASSRASSSSSP